MVTSRGLTYPRRHFGRWLERAVQERTDGSSGLDSRSAVARWLGFDRTRFHGWVRGRTLPSGEADVHTLTKLGATEDDIHSLIHLDRLEVFAMDAGMSPERLVLLAASVARAGGISIKEIVELLEETDVEALEQALAPRARRTDDP